MRSLYFQQSSGDGARLTYALREAREELIIFGDSRALHHYDTEALAETTGMSCYNTGEAAQSLIFSTAVLRVLLDRHQPRAVVLDLDPICLLKNPLDYDRLATLLPYASDHPALAEAVNLRSWAEPAKRLSRIYPFNSRVFSILRHNRGGGSIAGGYIPLEGTMNAEQIRKAESPDGAVETEIDPLKLAALHNFIDQASEAGCTVVLVASPIYNIGAESEQLDEILKRLDRPDVHFIDHLNGREFLGHPDLFDDRTHLNARGAEAFSKMLGEQLLPLVAPSR